MALTTPTIKQIQTNILNDIQSQTGQTVPTLAKMVLRVISLALAGVWIILYKYGTDAAKQRFPQTANEIYLAFLGALVNINQQQSTTFTGVLTCIGTDATGFIEAGTQLINTLSGLVYTISENTTIASGSFTAKIRASASGTAYNLSAGDVLTFVSPLANVNNTGTLASATITAQDKEDIEDYRTRVIEAYKRKPQGGASTDYVQWGEEPAAILNIYPYANSSYPGIVDIYVESAIQTDGIPTTEELALCTEYLKYDPTTGEQDRKPITAEINVYPITRTTYDVTLVGLTPDTADNRTLVNTTLTNYFLDREPYILGVSVDRKDSLNTSLASAAVANALESESAYFSNLKLFESGVEIYSAIMGRGQKAKLGTITYA